MPSHYVGVPAFPAHACSWACVLAYKVFCVPAPAPPWCREVCQQTGQAHGAEGAIYGAGPRLGMCSLHLHMGKRTWASAS